MVIITKVCVTPMGYFTVGFFPRWMHYVQDSIYLTEKDSIHKFLPAVSGISLSLYKSVRKRLFIRVDFPRPESPAKQKNKSKHKSVD